MRGVPGYSSQHNKYFLNPEHLHCPASVTAELEQLQKAFTWLNQLSIPSDQMVRKCTEIMAAKASIFEVESARLDSTEATRDILAIEAGITDRIKLIPSPESYLARAALYEALGHHDSAYLDYYKAALLINELEGQEATKYEFYVNTPNQIVRRRVNLLAEAELGIIRNFKKHQGSNYEKLMKRLCAELGNSPLLEKLKYSEKSHIYRMLGNAEDAFERGQYNKAILYLKEVKKYFEKTAEFQFILGLSAQNLSDTPQALKYYAEAKKYLRSNIREQIQIDILSAQIHGKFAKHAILEEERQLAANAQLLANYSPEKFQDFKLVYNQDRRLLELHPRERRKVPNCCIWGESHRSTEAIEASKAHRKQVAYQLSRTIIQALFNENPISIVFQEKGRPVTQVLTPKEAIQFLILQVKGIDFHSRARSEDFHMWPVVQSVLTDFLVQEISLHFDYPDLKNKDRLVHLFYLAGCAEISDTVKSRLVERFGTTMYRSIVTQLISNHLTEAKSASLLDAESLTEKVRSTRSVRLSFESGPSDIERKRPQGRRVLQEVFESESRFLDGLDLLSSLLLDKDGESLKPEIIAYINRNHVAKTGNEVSEADLDYLTYYAATTKQLKEVGEKCFYKLLRLITSDPELLSLSRDKLLKSEYMEPSKLQAITQKLKSLNVKHLTRFFASKEWNNYIKLLETLALTNKRFNQLAKSFELDQAISIPGGLTLDSLAITSIQRLPRWSLLITEINKTQEGRLGVAAELLHYQNHSINDLLRLRDLHDSDTNLMEL